MAKRPILNAPARQPRLGTLAELQSKAFPATRDLVAGLIPAHAAGALIGAPKVGKSFLLEQLSIAVASDEGDFLGHEVSHGNVLYLALEQTEASFKRRLAARLKSGAWLNRFHFRVRHTFAAKGKEAMDALRAQCEATEPTLVVIDTFAAFGESPSGNSLYHADYRNADQLRAIAAEYQTTIIAAHHSAKRAGGKDPVRDSVSTSGFAGGLNFLFELHRKHKSAPSTLTCSGNDIAEVELRLSFDGDTFEWSIAASVPQGRPRRKRELVIAWLAAEMESGPKPSKEVEAAAEVMGYGALLRSAKDELGIRSEKRGAVWYFIAPARKEKA